MGGWKAGKKMAKGAIQAVSPLTALLNTGGSKGPDNPYQASSFDYLRQPTPVAPQISSTALPKFSSYFTPGAFDSGAANSYITSMGAPSSVDAVQKGIEGQRLNDLIRSIGRTTNESLGRGTMDFYGRGLVDPSHGASSDIASVGLAQIAGQGQEASAKAYQDYALADLSRQKAQEDAARGAQKDVFGATIDWNKMNQGILGQGALANQGDYFKSLVANQGATQANQELELKRLLGLGGLESGAWKAGADIERAGYRPSYIDSILRNTSVNVGV